MHASGSSHRAAAARAQSAGLPWSGVVSSLSLPCLLPAHARPDGTCPPGGRLGLTSPPSRVLCAATTPTMPLSGRFACRALPDTLPASVVRGLPHGLVAWGKPPGLLVPRSPTPGLWSRRHVALPRSRVPPVQTCPALRPRWCPAHAPKRVWDCCLPVRAHRRLSPPYGLKRYPAVHDSTLFGAQSRGLHPRSLQLRTPIAGLARGVRY